MDILAVARVFEVVATFVIRVWKGDGRLSGPDRWALVTSFAAAITTFVVAPLLIDWVIDWVRVSTALWLLAVGLLAGGVTGAVLRWPELAWFAGTHPVRRAIGAGATLVSCTMIIDAAAT